MIILTFGCDSLETYLTNPEMRLPEWCPLCGSGLRKHDSFRRRVESLTVCAKIEIERLLCAVCNKVFSCLLEFLVPYKRLAARVNDVYVQNYIENELTLRETAWADNDELAPEATISRAQRAVAEAIKGSNRMLLELRQSGLSFSMPQVPVSCSAAPALKKRPHGFWVLCEIFAVLRQRFRMHTETICNAYRRLALVFRFPNPQSLKHALF